MGESRKSCLVLGRSRSCLVMLATYSIVCNRNPVVEFDGANSILYLIALCSSRCFFDNFILALFTRNIYKLEWFSVRFFRFFQYVELKTVKNTKLFYCCQIRNCFIVVFYCCQKLLFVNRNR